MGSISDSKGSQHVVVTGGSGFIGSGLVRRLDDAGVRVVSTYRTEPSPSLPDSVDQVPFTVGSLVRAFNKAHTVVHLAARTGGIEFQQRQPFELFFSNRALTDTVLRAVVDSQTRKLIIASTAAVYAPSSKPLSERARTVDLTTTTSAYVAGKSLDEIVVGLVRRTSHTNVITTRIGNVYGEGGHFDAERSSVIHALIRRAVDARETGRLVAWGSPQTVRSFVHVDDVADALALLITGDPSEHIYNVDSGVAVTVGRVATLIAECAAPGSKVTFDHSRPRGDPYRVLSIGRLMTLGFKPKVDLEEGIPRTVKAFVNEQEG